MATAKAAIAPFNVEAVCTYRSFGSEVEPHLELRDAVGASRGTVRLSRAPVKLAFRCANQL
jgi:hypothetical protein